MSLSDEESESSSSSSWGCSCNLDFNTDTDAGIDIDCDFHLEADNSNGFEVKIQYARYSDLDAISAIGIASFPSDPQWNYRYPYRQQYPDDHQYFARKRYAEWLAASRTPECMIVIIEGHRRERRRVLAFGIWRLPSMLSDDDDATHRMKPPTNQTRRDANYAHMKAYRDSSLEAEKRYFDPKFGRRRMDLAQLVTDPSFRRRGLATKLVQYGQMIATQYNWAIGVFASPMGEQLYKKLGFETLGKVVTKADDDDDLLEFPAMAWEPPNFVKLTSINTNHSISSTIAH